MASLSDFLGSASSALKGSASRTLSNALSQAAQGNLTDAGGLLLSGTQDATQTIGSSGGTAYADDFAGLQRRGDAVQNWCWYAVLPDIINPNAVGINGVGAPSIGCPWYYVQTANLPQRELNIESIKRNGHQTHRPDGYSVGSLTLGFFMDDESIAHQYLKAWSGQVLGNRNPKIVANQGSWGYPSSYMKDITIVVLSVRKNVLLNVKLINCWPTQNSALELTSGEASGMVQDVTFAVEDIDITVNNDKGLLATLLDTATGYGSTALGSVLGNQVNNVLTTLGI